MSTDATPGGQHAGRKIWATQTDSRKRVLRSSPPDRFEEGPALMARFSQHLIVTARPDCGDRGRMVKAVAKHTLLVEQISPAPPERGQHLDGTSPAPPERGQHLEELSEDVARNIETMAHLQTETDRKAGRIQRAIEKVTASIARPWTLNVILGGVAMWVIVNTLGPSVGLPQVDRPPFPWLQGLVSLSALIVTSMVLTTQSRQGHSASQRGNLELQVNLVAEQKIAKLIALLEELRRDLPSVRDRVDPVANSMAESVDHQAVLTILEETIEIVEATTEPQRDVPGT